MAFQYDIPFQVDLSDRVALVTGGNGGIGGMFCRALADCGATVIGLGRNLERCQKVADEINAGGGKADAISGDVTDEAAMLRVKDEIAKKYGGLNILINAAGGAVKSAMVPQDQMADPGEKTFFEVGADDMNYSVYEIERIGRRARARTGACRGCGGRLAGLASDAARTFRPDVPPTAG